jgi:hypothetical protein
MEIEMQTMRCGMQGGVCRVGGKGYAVDICDGEDNQWRDGGKGINQN